MDKELTALDAYTNRVYKIIMLIIPSSCLEFFISNMTFRIVCITATMMCINIITFFGGKFLVEELEKYVYTDPLTQLLTRRKMNSCLMQAYEAAEKNEEIFSLLMIDIDDFKKVNDTYGHDCGDSVLKYVSGAVLSAVKKDDKVFRWGGEEILVLLKCDGESAVKVGEHIKKIITDHRIFYSDDIKVSVSVTIGVASYTAGCDIKTLTEEADRNLYYGKQNGKNRVVYKKV
ncbi:MAG: GGDEF domain-containing protein [Lachnospiraceae bacterium]|nr:GGDEF domain-containing protein [Lachnospiraceae bacterium]